MADKKRKKPRHTNLVLPGDKKNSKTKPEDRLRRVAPPAAGLHGGTNVQAPVDEAPLKGAAGQPEHGEGVDAAQAAGPAATPQAGAAGRPQAEPTGKIVAMPKRKKRLSPVKRKRRMRRIRLLVLVFVLALVLLIYSTGTYLTVFTLVSDWADSIYIALQDSGGFPKDYALTGYMKAEAMGDKGAALIGERDLSILSSNGYERRFQHGFASPGLSAGDTRVVLYQRGGREFVVEGRRKTLGRRTVEQDIQFAEMSPAGWLAVATASRYQATLSVYSPGYDIGDPLMELTLVEEKPVLARFCGDNRNLLLGCYTAKDGSITSTIHLLRTDRDSIQATITAEDAQLLQAEYLNRTRILAVYDTHAALYNNHGEELARLDFGGRSLAACDIDAGYMALVFDGGAQEGFQVLLANAELKQQCEVAVPEGSGTPDVLAAENGFYLLAGQQVLAWDTAGNLADTLLLESHPAGLVRAGQPLLLTSEALLPLAGMLNPSAASSTPVRSAGSGPSASAAASAA